MARNSGPGIQGHIGHAAIRQGHKALHAGAHVLLKELAETSIDGTPRERLTELATVPLLVIDDLGMHELPNTPGEDLLELVMRRQARASTFITSSRPVEDREGCSATS